MATWSVSFTEDEIPAVIAALQKLDGTPVITPPPPPDAGVPLGAIRIWQAELDSTIQISTGAPIPQGNVWVAGDQLGMGYSHFEGDDLVCQLSNMNGRKGGSRDFPTHAGRWDLVSAPPPGLVLLGRTIRFIYEAVLDDIPNNYGDGYFCTDGIEIKPESSAEATVQVNVERVGGKLRYWLGGAMGVQRLTDAPVIPIGVPHTVVLDVLMSPKGHAKLMYGGATLEGDAPTTLSNGWTGIAWCLYTTAIKDAGVYRSVFRNRRAYLLP